MWCGFCVICHLKDLWCAHYFVEKVTFICLQTVGFGTSKASFSSKVGLPEVVIFADFHKQVQQILSISICQVSIIQNIS